jgi:hypothetical protein
MSNKPLGVAVKHQPPQVRLPAVQIMEIPLKAEQLASMQRQPEWQRVLSNIAPGLQVGRHSGSLFF